jgi:hypothetical protein
METKNILHDLLARGIATDGLFVKVIEMTGLALFAILDMEVLPRHPKILRGQ